MFIHIFIFDEICNKDMNAYMDFIKSIQSDFVSIKKELMQDFSQLTIPKIRYLALKLTGIVSYLDNMSELVFICKSILHVDKNHVDMSVYLPYIEMLRDYDTKNFI